MEEEKCSENIIVISLWLEEWKALKFLAQQRRRTVADQAAMIIRQELEAYGLVPWKPTQKLLETFSEAGG